MCGVLLGAIVVVVSKLVERLSVVVVVTAVVGIVMLVVVAVMLVVNLEGARVGVVFVWIKAGMNVGELGFNFSLM